MKSSKYALSFWIGLFLFSVYLLSFSGKLHVMDELAVFSAGNNLAQYGRADINPLIWTHHWTPHPPGIWGQDDNLYTKKAPGISFLTTPLLWLGHRLPKLNTVHVGLLTNSIVTALTASLLFVWLIDLGYSHRAAALTALGYGLLTIAWVYARMFWGLSILGLCFLAAVWAAYRATNLKYERWTWLLLCGTAVALGLTLRFEAGMAVVLVGLYLFFSYSRKHDRLKYLALYLTPTVIIGLALAYFNFVRYGGLGETGYTQEILFKEPWVGAFGLLFSPGNGLFLFSPFMLLLFFGLRPAWRRLSRHYFLLIAALCVFYWIFYGSWFAWGGTWGWGPRFFLPTLPLLMLFVAEPLEWLFQFRAKQSKTQSPISSPQSPHSTSHISPQLIYVTAWAGVWIMAALSLIINFLGIAVDFNEHFLRLGRNDNFVFNWEAFPPLGHWRILQDGLLDIIWLQSTTDGMHIEWSIVLPAFTLIFVTTTGLIFSYQNVRQEDEDVVASPGASLHSFGKLNTSSSPFILVVFLVVILTYQTLLGTTRVALADEQTQADLPVLDVLASSAKADDVLLVSMPPFGDVWEFTTLTMAHLDTPLPTYTWIETPPRAILPDERERVWQASTADADNVWLFERWLTQNDGLSTVSTQFNREAFPVHEQWFAQSGKLTLYALAKNSSPAVQIPAGVPFEGGLQLVDFSVDENTVIPEAVLKVQLTWQAAGLETLGDKELPAGGVIGFVHLLNETGSETIAQQDRLLIDLQNTAQSPLLPGQAVEQGYGLRLPQNLPPGSYPLIAGVYSAGTGQPLLRTDDSPDGFIYLTNIIVKRDE